MEAEAREGLGVAIEKPRRPAAQHAIERGHALLPVEKELHHASGKWTVAAVGSRARFCRPDQQTTHRMPAVE